LGTIFAVAQAYACQCGGGPRGTNEWETAKLRANGNLVIFEGKLERQELHWNALNSAKDGAMVPADMSAEPEKGSPHMLLTFRVERAYKGVLAAEVQISTGLGGGDCGAQFAPGLSYLVFAYRSSLDNLQVDMCSPGGWVGSAGLAPVLRYLRNEPPVPGDLSTLKDRESEKRRSEVDGKNYAAATGKICGTVTLDKTKDAYAGTISFLSAAGYSPYGHPEAEVRSDGTFCSWFLGPGSYYLYAAPDFNEGPAASVYYPGVSERAKATAIKIGAGQTSSNIAFKVPILKRFSVRGMISTNDKSGLGPESVYVTLIGPDRRATHGQAVDFQSFFPLPKVKYFKIEGVLPGHYIAVASVAGRGWYTTKAEVDVPGQIDFISLQLVHKK